MSRLGRLLSVKADVGRLGGGAMWAVVTYGCHSCLNMFEFLKVNRAFKKKELTYCFVGGEAI